MIYKNNTTVTGIYLNGQLIANGYKGQVQFFGQTESDTIEVTVTGDGLITNQLVVGKTYSVTYDLVENTPNRVFGGGYYVFAGDDTDIDAVYGDTLVGQYNYYVSEEIQAGNNPINYSGTFTFTAATTSLYGFWCLEQSSGLEWDSGTVTIEEVQEEPIPNYLCFTSRADNNTIGFTASETVTDPISLQYSTDGKTWSEWDYTNGGITINNGDKVYLKGINNVFATGSSSNAYSSFSFSGTTEGSGNIMSLLYGDDFEGQTDLTGRDYVFCYMFYNCSSLTTAPELPATSLSQYCYYGMFRYCTSLTTAPELPATTLVNNCYTFMFRTCINLNYIKAMFTTTPSTSYTSAWVSGVSSTGTFVKNVAATWTEIGVNGIPTGWTVELYISEEPIITVTETSSTFTISVSTASNLGTIELKVNNQLVNNPYTGSKPLYNTYYAIEATNTDSGKPSNTKTEQVLIGGTKTADPVITYNQNDQSVTASGNGTVLLYKNNTSVSNPYIFDSTEIGQTFTFTATAQESGKLISNTVTETITPEESTNPVWRKVTDASELANGCDILVVDETHGLVFNGSIYAQGKNGIEVIITNNTIEDSADLNSCIVHYGPGYLQYGDYYIGSRRSGATWSSEPATGNLSNYMTITITISNGHALIGNAGNNRLLLFNTNNGSNGGYDPTKNFYFRWYTESTLTNSPNQYFYVQVYKLS